MDLAKSLLSSTDKIILPSDVLIADKVPKTPNL